MIRPRQGRTAVAVLAIAAFAAVVVWFGVLKEPRAPAPARPRTAAPAATPPASTPAESARTPSPPASAPDAPRIESAAVAPPTAEPPRQAAAPAPESPREAGAAADPAREAAAPAPPVPLAPSFDVVRVEPSGESVIAGRAAPGATIHLLRDGVSHARAAADQSGLFAFVPPPLPPGSHEIVLQSIAPDGTRTRSRESITIVVADDKATKPLVALASPDRPTVLLSNPDRPSSPAEPAPPAPARGSDAAAAPTPGAPAETAARPEQPPAAAGPRPQARIAAIDAEDGGRLFVSGQAAPGATVRLYLNDTLIAPGGAGADGKVAFAISRGVRPGAYRVRLDDVDPVSGEVKSRAEVQFSMPAQVAVPLPPHVPPLVTGPNEVAGLAPAPAPSAPAAAAGSAAGSTAASRPTASATAATAQPSAGERQAAERAVAAGTVLIPEINTAIVARGDNLWNISRRIYGQGLRYTVIYGANQPQIRNPDLIYPGQVFVLPPEQRQGPRL